MTELHAIPPAGFPNCSSCPYWINGPAYVCVQCAGAAVEPIAQPHCPVCSQSLAAGGGCSNQLCLGPRYIRRIHALAAYSGNLSTAIKALKYDNKWGWAIIFGRLVTGYLDANMHPGDVDLILPNPTYRHPSADPTTQHTEQVLRQANSEDVFARWPFAPDGVLVKATATASTAGKGAAEKAAAADALRGALLLPDPSLIRGRRILLYDDVCTTGAQLNAVAHFLREHGATLVDGLVLARTQWRR